MHINGLCLSNTRLQTEIQSITVKVWMLPLLHRFLMGSYAHGHGITQKGTTSDALSCMMVLSPSPKLQAISDSMLALSLIPRPHFPHPPEKSIRSTTYSVFVQACQNACALLFSTLDVIQDYVPHCLPTICWQQWMLNRQS